MNDMIKIVQALEDFSILSKAVTKTIKNKIKEQKGGLLSMLGASLLGNMLAGRRNARAGSGNKKGERNCKGWIWKRMVFLTPSHPLTNFEI